MPRAYPAEVAHTAKSAGRTQSQRLETRGRFDLGRGLHRTGSASVITTIPPARGWRRKTFDSERDRPGWLAVQGAHFASTPPSSREIAVALGGGPRGSLEDAVRCFAEIGRTGATEIVDTCCQIECARQSLFAPVAVPLSNTGPSVRNGACALMTVCRERLVDSSGCESRPVTGRSNRKHLERFKEVTNWTETLLEKAPLGSQRTCRP